MVRIRFWQGSARLRLCVLLTGVAFLPSLAFAFDTTPVTTAQAYLELPLGASQAGSNSMIGFRFYTPVPQVDSFTGLAPGRPPLADLKFSRRGLVGIYVNGVNVIPPSLVVRAAEASGEAAGINWLIPAGIVAAGVIGIAYSNQKSQRSPEPATAAAPAAPACVPGFPAPPGPGGPPPPPAPC